MIPSVESHSNENDSRTRTSTFDRGRPIEDSDLMIAAQANRRGAVVVTDNVRHFRDTADRVETW